MVKGFCLRKENCWIWALDGGFLVVEEEEPLHPRKMESPREKTEWAVVPYLGILRPIPDG